MRTNNELMHYGVKGMKWGVRHEPERTGFFRRGSTPSYAKTNRGKSTVMRMTSSSSRASRQDAKRRRIRNILLATAGVSAAAVVGLEVYKHGLMKADRILQPGTIVQNIGAKGKNFNAPFYAVDNSKDRLFYLKAFSKKATPKDAGRNMATILTNDKPVNIAGKKSMDIAYKRAYGNNPIKREIFYRRLGGLNYNQKAGFNRELRRMGYNGHKDINDMQFVFGGDTPTVYFGKASGLHVRNTSEINIKKAKKIKVLTGVGKRSIAQTGAMGVGIGSLYGAHRIEEKRNGGRNDVK